MKSSWFRSLSLSLFSWNPRLWIIISSFVKSRNCSSGLSYRSLLCAHRHSASPRTKSVYIQYVNLTSIKIIAECVLLVKPSCLCRATFQSMKRLSTLHHIFWGAQFWKANTPYSSRSTHIWWLCIHKSYTPTQSMWMWPSLAAMKASSSIMRTPECTRNVADQNGRRIG